MINRYANSRYFTSPNPARTDILLMYSDHKPIQYNTIQ